MKIKIQKALLSFILIFSSSNLFAEIEKYTCVDIKLLEVDRENQSTREYERAAQIPQEVLEKIQFITVGEVTRNQNGLKAMKGTDDSQCMDEHSLTVEGMVTDYKKGNRAVRYLVGLGAGKQKIQTNLVLKDKATGDVLAEKEVIDRKIGGLAGGSKDKGKRDYAEKVNKFIKKSIGRK